MPESFALFLLTETPLHPGAGSTLGAIDLPIQREVHTQHPIVWASGLKGALRELAGAGRKSLSPPMEAIFGPETDNASAHGGAAIFTESRVILFPVACTTGIFVWVTCPGVLHRLSRDLRALHSGMVGSSAKAFLDLQIPKSATRAAASNPSIKALHFDAGASVAVTDDAQESAKAQALANWFSENAIPAGKSHEYWRDKIKTSLVVVPDDEFSFLVLYATQVQSHVKIGASGTVEQGPWLEEAIPPDTLLCSAIVIPEILDTNVRNKLNGSQTRDLMQSLLHSSDGSKRFQMCGGRSTGMGWVAPRLIS